MFWTLTLTYLVTTIHYAQSIQAFPPSPKRPPPDRCLTGYMTDVQGWVDEDGALTSRVDLSRTIDVSAASNAATLLTNQLRRTTRAVRFLSLARCSLTRVPAVFRKKDAKIRSLARTVEYLTLYGNSFSDVSASGSQYDLTFNATDATELAMGYSKPDSAAWSTEFYKITFPKLLELDLRKCSIETLSSNVFQNMPMLQALYIGENNITTIYSNAFFGLDNLMHLDLSRNFFNRNQPLRLHSDNIFRDLKSLRSLDLSFTKLNDKNVKVFTRLSENFKTISLCHTQILRLNAYTFNGTSLKFIDLSGNFGILKSQNVLKGTEKTLRTLYAEEVGLDTFEIFVNFRKLEVLKLNKNELPFFNPKVVSTLTNLKILDLTNNKLTSWFHNLFTSSSLEYLSLKDNYINLITNEMMMDFAKIKYLSLSGNFIVCNCNVKELYELALRNEKNRKNYLLIPDGEDNIAFNYFNGKIKKRNNLTMKCDHYKTPCLDFKGNLTAEGDYLLLDYDEERYNCMLPSVGQTISFNKMKTCQQTSRQSKGPEDMLNEGRNELLALIIIPTLTVPLLIFAYIFRKNFKYCFVTIRNSALLSLINKECVIDDGTIFNYDVFVSYCNEDRDWVLDYLLPHVETDCNVSVCLHERDFEVGLSILENIVSCMDRSRSIMLIISKQFLLSQWCQFEMHLAQHRLLETRREDLILILLEDIPRRARPTTLHYLMLTKTYIVWPKVKEEEEVFWRRLKKSLVTYQLRQTRNEPLARGFLIKA